LKALERLHGNATSTLRELVAVSRQGSARIALLSAVEK
jgi:hypothetical protein